MTCNSRCVVPLGIEILNAGVIPVTYTTSVRAEVTVAGVSVTRSTIVQLLRYQQASAPLLCSMYEIITGVIDLLKLEER